MTANYADQYNNGEIEEVFPRIWRVPVPLPDNPLNYLNSYFILSDDKTTIVDVGFDHPDCEKALDDAMHKVQNRMNMQATVFNPLIGYLTHPNTYDERSMQARDASTYRVSAELLPLKNQPDLFYLADGDVYHNGSYRFRIITTPGHDDWHICLYEPTAKILIAGDHVLERITPTIMSWVCSYDALREFLTSLDKVRDLDVDLILPGHGRPFTGVAERVDFLKSFHANRLEELYQLVASGHASLIDVARNASWKHPHWDEWTIDQKFYSLGETFAHLVYLVNEGRVVLTTCENCRRFYPADSFEMRRKE